MVKEANPDHPVQELIVKRWSPYGFSGCPVSKADLCALFEAARWAASSYNEQPWRFIVATKQEPEGHDRMLTCLVEANQAWAKAAPVLALGVIQHSFSRNNKSNRVAAHDLGLAVGNLLVEATARGIFVHQMAGILQGRARYLYEIPPDAEAWTGIAIGYAAPPDHLPEALRERDLAPRTRKPLSEFVFGNGWNESAEFLT